MSKRKLKKRIKRLRRQLRYQELKGDRLTALLADAGKVMGDLVRAL